ncbi:MAG: glycosyltransferase family 39 protein [Gammaproteobacteria bacterium]|nr:MAG: glycosyltransferase family 39 protein [Gammaproteobacteria bacterium]
MSGNRPAATTTDAILPGPRVRPVPVALALVVLCILPGLLAIALRPPVPLDELRYLAVAWEMWRDGNFLVPHLNGLPYSHKPPALFWIIHAGWALFGVSEWWPRLIPALAGLAGVALTRRLAAVLWPQDRGTAALAPWLLAGCMAWLIFTQMVMFDVLLTVWVLLGMWGLWSAARADRPPGWLAIAAAIGAGLLSKGPVVLVQLLVPAVLAPLWQSTLRQRLGLWYLRLLAAATLGIGIALLWAVPAAQRGGPDYAAAILWHQTADRMEQSFAHARAWWFYLPILPLLFLPWSALPATWRRSAAVPRDAGLRFLLLWIGGVVAAMSLISGKQPHYLLPVLPALAILTARALAGARGDTAAADRRVLGGLPALLSVCAAAWLLWSAHRHGLSWRQSGAGWPLAALPLCLWTARAGSIGSGTRRAAGTMGSVFVLVLGGLAHNPVAVGFDLRAAADSVRDLQNAGAEVVVLDHYQGQLTFLGRLPRPVPIVARAELPAWTARHPGAYLIVFKDALPSGTTATKVAEFLYRSQRLTIWRIGNPGVQHSISSR